MEHSHRNIINNLRYFMKFEVRGVFPSTQRCYRRFLLFIIHLTATCWSHTRNRMQKPKIDIHEIYSGIWCFTSRAVDKPSLNSVFLVPGLRYVQINFVWTAIFFVRDTEVCLGLIVVSVSEYMRLVVPVADYWETHFGLMCGNCVAWRQE
jgi:hypothetical protein